MKKVWTSSFDLAQRFVGVKEIAGAASNPQVLAMLRLDSKWPEGDHVPWCSAFVNYITWLLRLPRSKSLMARSWLQVGTPITLEQAEVGNDIVIFKRGSDPQPGPETINAPGHVGFFAGIENNRVLVLGGNQSDAVNISGYPVANVIGVRRLYV